MATAVGDKTPGQVFAMAFGVVYLAIGLLGFLFLSGEQKLVGIFGVDVLHNIAHLGVGGLLLYGSRDGAQAKTVNLVVGVVYLLLAIVGFAGILKYEEGDILLLNGADNVLHAATAVLALYFGTAGAGMAGMKEAPPA